MKIECPTCAAAYELDAAAIGPKGRKVRCTSCQTLWRVPPAETAATPAEAAHAPSDLAFGAPIAVSAGYEDEALAAVGLPPRAGASPARMMELQPPADAGNRSDDDLAAPAAKAPRRVKWTKTKSAAGAGRKRGFALPPRLVGPAIAAGLLLACGLASGLAIVKREAVVRALPQTAKLYALIGRPVNLRGLEINAVASRILDEGDVPLLVVDGEIRNVTDRAVTVPSLRFGLDGERDREIYAWTVPADRPTLEPGESIVFRRRLASPPQEAKTVRVRFVDGQDKVSGLN